MIRVSKSTTVPSSLLRIGNIEYNHQDVQEHLIDDQRGKCYLCERQCVTDYQIEHLLSAANFSDSKTTWENLFLACSYCNGKKSNNFDNILDPSHHNIEDIIDCTHDISKKQLDFSGPTIDDNRVSTTINLLNRIFNGTGKIRVIKEERFYEYFASRMVNFLSALNEFDKIQSDDTRNRVIEDLGVDKEFLAFKYQIVKSRPDFYTEFETFMVWNKIGE